MKQRRAGVLLLLNIMAFLAAGCGSPGDDSGYAYASGQGSTALPSETLVDWVGYADIVAEVSVVGEKEKVDKQTTDRGTGLVLRDLTITVTSVLWHRDPLVKTPSEFTFVAWGWIERDAGRVPMVEPGRSRLEVGHTYLLALTSSGTAPGWTSIGPGAILPFDGGVVGTGERAGAVEGKPDVGKSAAFKQLEGKSADEVAALLAATPPDPLAEKYADLPSVERYAKVAAESASAAPTS